MSARIGSTNTHGVKVFTAVRDETAQKNYRCHVQRFLLGLFRQCAFAQQQQQQQQQQQLHPDFPGLGGFLDQLPSLPREVYRAASDVLAAVRNNGRRSIELELQSFVLAVLKPFAIPLNLGNRGSLVVRFALGYAWDHQLHQFPQHLMNVPSAINGVKFFFKACAALLFCDRTEGLSLSPEEKESLMGWLNTSALDLPPTQMTAMSDLGAVGAITTNAIKLVESRSLQIHIHTSDHQFGTITIRNKHIDYRKVCAGGQRAREEACAILRRLLVHSPTAEGLVDAIESRECPEQFECLLQDVHYEDCLDLHNGQWFASSPAILPLADKVYRELSAHFIDYTQSPAGINILAAREYCRDIETLFALLAACNHVSSGQAPRSSETASTQLLRDTATGRSSFRVSHGGHVYLLHPWAKVTQGKVGAVDILRYMDLFLSALYLVSCALLRPIYERLAQVVFPDAKPADFSALYLKDGQRVDKEWVNRAVKDYFVRYVQIPGMTPSMWRTVSIAFARIHLPGVLQLMGHTNLDGLIYPLYGSDRSPAIENTVLDIQAGHGTSVAERKYAATSQDPANHVSMILGTQMFIICVATHYLMGNVYQKDVNKKRVFNIGLKVKPGEAFLCPTTIRDGVPPALQFRALLLSKCTLPQEACRELHVLLRATSLGDPFRRNISQLHDDLRARTGCCGSASLSLPSLHNPYKRTLTTTVGRRTGCDSSIQGNGEHHDSIFRASPQQVFSASGMTHGTAMSSITVPVICHSPSFDDVDNAVKMLRLALKNMDANFHSSHMRRVYEVIVSAKRDGPVILITAPTGSGKTLAYIGLAALYPDSFVIVVSPLISLLKDIEQRCKGVVSTCEVRPGDTRQGQGKLKTCGSGLILMTPEMLMEPAVQHWVSTRDKEMRVKGFFIDEPQCCYQYGKEIRPAMLAIHMALPRHAPVFALTATLPVCLRRPLADSIFCRNMHMLPGSTVQNFPYDLISFVDNPGMNIEGKWLDDSVQAQLDNIQLGQVVIFYLPNVKNVKEKSCNLEKRFLDDDTVLVMAFYGDLLREQKAEILGFCRSARKKVVLIATVFSLGMGVNLSNVAAVTFVGPPDNLTLLVQGAGRLNRGKTLGHIGETSRAVGIGVARIVIDTVSMANFENHLKRRSPGYSNTLTLALQEGMHSDVLAMQKVLYVLLARGQQGCVTHCITTHMDGPELARFCIQEIGVPNCRACEQRKEWLSGVYDIRQEQKVDEEERRLKRQRTLGGEQLDSEVPPDDSSNQVCPQIQSLVPFSLHMHGSHDTLPFITKQYMGGDDFDMDNTTFHGENDNTAPSASWDGGEKDSTTEVYDVFPDEVSIFLWVVVVHFFYIRLSHVSKICLFPSPDFPLHETSRGVGLRFFVGIRIVVVLIVALNHCHSSNTGVVVIVIFVIIHCFIPAVPTWKGRTRSRKTPPTNVGGHGVQGGSFSEISLGPFISTCHVRLTYKPTVLSSALTETSSGTFWRG
jgi:hypothetical protein